MSESVLDASALIAYLNDEPGSDLVESALTTGACISAVNWAEVLSKVARDGGDPDALRLRLEQTGLLGQTLQIVAFAEQDALRTAHLAPLGRSHGLSLGDRDCLALALRLGLPAVTADRIWQNLSLSVTVQVIR